MTSVGEATVGALPEGAAFSADGSYLYVGNFIDSDSVGVPRHRQLS